MVVLVVPAALAAGTWAACHQIRRQAIATLGDSAKYKPEPVQPAAASPAAPGLRPSIEGPDLERKRIDVVLVPVARGFDSPTDVQFPPGESRLAVVLEKSGTAKWVWLPDGSSGDLFKVEVLTESEEGLLGLAFHPRFSENGRFFVSYVAAVGGDDTSVVEEWRVPPGADLRSAKPAAQRRLMLVKQPYQNHDAGQLAFGPDGFLYIGWGDGGYADDPHGHGQNPSTLLGEMLRIDVDREEGGKPYGIPADNPFVGKPGFQPEIFARGLRNPWRYCFDPKGRLIVADVGQYKWEEIDIVVRGANYGWNVREGRHCFNPEHNCRTEGLTDPIYEYPRDDGGSITGGYVYEGKSVPALVGKYLFADFVSGRVWAIDLPGAHDGDAGPAWALGKWSLLPATFGKAADGEVYLADFGEGVLYRFGVP